MMLKKQKLTGELAQLDPMRADPMHKEIVICSCHSVIWSRHFANYSRHVLTEVG